MPETGFCLSRLKAHLRSAIGLYLAAIAALCFLNHLVYTVTRPNISDDERLKIMLLNLEIVLSEEELDVLSAQLLTQLQEKDDGLLALEFEPLPHVQAGEAESEMLLSVKLTGGFGDLYLSDADGLALLEAKDAVTQSAHLESCVLTGGGAYLSVMANTTDPTSAEAAFSVLVEMLEE